MTEKGSQLAEETLRRAERVNKVAAEVRGGRYDSKKIIGSRDIPEGMSRDVGIKGRQ